MKYIMRLFMKGLFALLPIAITSALLYWLGSTAESTLGKFIEWLLPDGWYLPGLGILAGFVFFVLVGLLLNAYIFRKLAGIAEKIFESTPIVKVVYNSVKDVTKFAHVSGEDSDLKTAVLVSISEDTTLVGFITKKSLKLGKQSDLIAVYLPMSYQIGGFTVFLPESKVKNIDMDVEDAMRLVLTAGISGTE